MTDEKLVQNDAANGPQNENNDAERAMVGKIARLPASLAKLFQPANGIGRRL